MDGTLVNTLPDIAAAIDAALAELRMHPLAVEPIGVFIGNGSRFACSMNSLRSMSANNMR